MKALSVLSSSLVLCLAGALTACAVTSDDPDPTIGDSGTVSPDPGDGASPPGGPGDAPTSNAATRITITSTQPLAMVAYREVSDPRWHPATEITTGKFVARVRGPYWVTAVCQSPLAGPPGFADVWRAGRTLDDAHELVMPFLCFGEAPRALPEVTGTFLQPSNTLGTIAISGAPTANQALTISPVVPFTFDVPQGTYSLYGFNDTRIAIQHDLEIKRSTAVFPIDLTIGGSPYVQASLSLVNANPLAFQHAVSRIEQRDGRAPIQLFDDLLPVRVVPNDVLASENQTVSAQATVFNFTEFGDRSEIQSSRRPWRLGDDPTFVEPDQIGNASWLFDGFGQLVARWDSLPPATIFSTEAFGTSAIGSFVDDFTELSPAFRAATAATSTVIDTQIPGFQPGWTLDYHSPINGYTRTMIAQDVLDLVTPEHGAILTSLVSEDVFTPSPLAAAPAREPAPRLPGWPFAR